jgi:hypothetical protein
MALTTRSHVPSLPQTDKKPNRTTTPEIKPSSKSPISISKRDAENRKAHQLIRKVKI